MIRASKGGGVRGVCQVLSSLPHPPLLPHAWSLLWHKLTIVTTSSTDWKNSQWIISCAICYRTITEINSKRVAHYLAILSDSITLVMLTVVMVVAPCRAIVRKTIAATQRIAQYLFREASFRQTHLCNTLFATYRAIIVRYPWKQAQESSAIQSQKASRDMKRIAAGPLRGQGIGVPTAGTVCVAATKKGYMKTEPSAVPRSRAILLRVRCKIAGELRFRFAIFRMRQTLRSGEGVLQGNGRPKECFWGESVFFLPP